MSGTAGLLLAILLAAAAVQSPASAAPGDLPRTHRKLAGYASPSAGEPTVVSYDWHVRLKRAAPDCFSKEIITVNGEFQPTITVRQGNILQVTLYNGLPADYPMTTAGISIHWHGLSLHSPDHTAAWYDGTPYVAQCPVKPGHSFVYRFTITDNPGTYFWHDHSSANRADGLAGPLIILPPAGVTPPGMPQYDTEETLFIQDWFHAQGETLAFKLGRPFDPALQTNVSGAWEFVNLPQSTLINGQGFYGDCQLNPVVNGTQGALSLPCNLTTVTVLPDESVQQPYASAANTGCTHYTTTVTPGQTTLYRIINAGTLVYQTVCFEDHPVTIVAADAYATAPLNTTCVDINAGQRYDVLLTASQPNRTYAITVASQYRPGAPNGYGILRYSNGPTSDVPASPTIQPGAVAPWNQSKILEVKINDALLPTLAPPNRTTVFGVNLTQPLVKPTGQLRWALNNVAHSDNPTCTALETELKENINYLRLHDADVGPNGTANPLSKGVLGTQNGNDVGVTDKRFVYLNDAFPINPVAGLHVVHIYNGEVIDVIVQNNAANAFNGDYRPNNGRSAAEQHPFHLHGYHFWLLGSGQGFYYDALNSSSLNTVNPPYRDVVSILEGGYAVLRFKAGNPGLWLFHCHILWHQLIGQALIFADTVSEIGSPPPHPPACPSSCPAAFAPWAPSTVQELYGDSPFELPTSP